MRTTERTSGAGWVGAVTAALLCGCPAEAPRAPDCNVQEFRDVMIPMRDGKELAAFVRAPADARCRLPTVLLQTPYDKENARSLYFQGSEAEPLFDSPDYAFAVVDWRGFYGSVGAGTATVDVRADDGFDTVEWIATQPWSDGKVGTWGVSALCGQQYATAARQPPHLAAAVPIFCGQNSTYEQYFPGGVLRREYYAFIAGYYGNALAASHPYRDALWLAVEGLYRPADVQVPMLVVGGWWDLYPRETLRTFDALVTSSAAEVRGLHRLLVGPWIHFAVGGETSVGRAPTAQELAYHDLERRVQRDSLAFFDLHLRGVQGAAATWATVRYARAGEGLWDSSDTWPPTGTAPRTLYLSAGGGLSETAPASGEASLPYDPLDPSPTVGGATLLPAYAHGPADQASVLARADALAFTTAPLDAPLRARGAISVQLDVATTGADTDFAVRLTDVDSAGTHLLIGEGIRRLKLRSGLGAPIATSPGTRYTVLVELTADLAYTFAVGHRVGVIVTSSNWPRFDRNPNTGADYWVDGAAATAVTNTLFLDGASRLVLSAAPP
jgi:predicted acyl esterase